MICMKDALLSILPVWIRADVDRLSAKKIQQIHLRVGQRPILDTSQGAAWLDTRVREEDVLFCINTASKYSPWAARSMANGYITAPGGHRIGICGETVVQNGIVTGMKNIRSLCIRVAEDFPGIAKQLATVDGSLLIIGKPGVGKTTLLRDLIRQRALTQNVGVVDQREELFPMQNGNACFETGGRTDIISGCEKTKGIEILIRTMSPQTVAVDEITAPEDCTALLNAAWCGVQLLATAHAERKTDLFRRPIYRPLMESGIFTSLLILHSDRSWTMERINYGT